MATPIKAKFKWTAEQHKTAIKTSLKYGQKLTRRLQYLGIIFVLIFIISFFLGDTARNIAFPLIPCGVVFLLIGQITVFVSRYKFRNNPFEDVEIEYTFTEECYHSEGDGFNQTVSWAKTFQFVDAPNGFLIYPQKSLFYWIPFEAFESSSDIDSVRQIVKAKVKNYKTFK